MRIAQLNGCLLCKKFRVADDLSDLVRRAGSSDTPNLDDDRGAPPTEAFYSAVAQWRDSGEFSLRERLAIEYAERIALSPIELPHDDEFWARLQARFDDAEIVDLTYSITTWIATGRFVHVLGLDGACELDPARRPAQVA
jgi:alkylhydroperoxidase family enzyme